MRIERTSVLLVCLATTWLVSTTRLASAQDTHYWNNQYGPRSMLLSGAVVGGVFDMSATFYNPGILGYIEDPELLLSANVYQASALKIEDGAGDGIDLKTTDFNLLPNMLAGAFRWKWLGANKLAYSFLTRYRFNAEIKGARVGRKDVLPEPGIEDFAGGIVFAEEAKELWTGLTWARGFTDRVGFGITQYLSIRGQDSRYNLFAQALTDSGDMAIVYDVDDYSADVYSVLWKAGVGFNFWPVTVGLTLTTPNVPFYSTGSAAVNSTRLGVDVDDDGVPDETFEANVQEDVTADYRSPLSVGVGAGLHLRRVKIFASAEWFDAVSLYDVLKLEPYVSQGTGETVTPLLRHKTASVINWAAGIEIPGDRIDTYISFNTDHSSFDKESDVAVTGFDIYHATAGTNIALRKTEFMIGVSYAWGSQTKQQIIDLSPDDNSTATDPNSEVDLIYDRITFMLGFSVKL